MKESAAYTNKPIIAIKHVPPKSPLKQLTQSNVSLSHLLSSTAMTTTPRPSTSNFTTQSSIAHVQNDLQRAPFTQTIPHLVNSIALFSNNASVHLDSRPNFESQFISP